MVPRYVVQTSLSLTLGHCAESRSRGAVGGLYSERGQMFLD